MTAPYPASPVSRKRRSADEMNSERCIRDGGIGSDPLIHPSRIVDGTVSRTGRPEGGEHRWFIYPADRNIPSSQSKLGDRLDIRAVGGYAMHPGVHLVREKITTDS
jgi:hypothetical protein